MTQTEIMILEDEPMISFDLADFLQEAGYRINGPYATAAEALAALSEAGVALAILDVDLGDGSTSEPVAEWLEASGTPFVFVSGYNYQGSELIRRFPAAGRISKPWEPQDLLNAIARSVGPRLVA
ncbi:response regulator [Acuticoccus yangtzensis]|uniref:response regulator n=1 Tax=Acuticoccus yangtzensis TaxID=1443441 RepID=UPI000949603E|nr:response regulator [Acuticoccus yangtzensis]